MRAVVCVRIVAPIEYARVGLGRSCGRSRSQLTPPLVVMSSCGVRSGHRRRRYCSRISCERANEQREVYSPVGWVFSATTCEPCAAAGAGSAEERLGDVLQSGSSSAEVKKIRAKGCVI